MLSSSVRLFGRQSRVVVPTSSRRFSNIVTSPSVLPSLTSDVVNQPVQHFVMKDFLKPDQKNKTYVLDGVSGSTMTYGESYYASYSIADSLKDRGLKPNDVVSIVSPNHLHYFSVIMGTMLADGVASTVNPLYSVEELDHQFSLTESTVVVSHPMCLDRVIESCAGKQRQIVIIDRGIPDATIEQLLSKHAAHKVIRLSALLSTDEKRPIKHDYSWSKATFDPHKVAVIPFSSGTTGRSKGVMISHKNLISNILQTMAFEGDALVAPPGSRQRSLLIPLPFFHIFGFTAGMLLAAHAGCRHIFMPQFDLKRFLEIIQEYKVERSFVVPPIVLAMAKHPLIDNYDLSSLQALMSGAAPLGYDVQNAAAQRLKCIVKQAWGMTETSPAAAITPDSQITNPHAAGTAGLLLPGTEGKIVDPSTGADLPPHEEGELLVRGPQIMLGYYKNPEATAKTINAEGWLHTGDIAKFDVANGGWLHITDRLKELIKYKGYQVPPAELEAIILSMPQVSDVIVIPVADEEAGEIPRAYVVKKESSAGDVSEEDIVKFVNDKVSPFKRLRGGVVFVKEVPKSASGKLLRRVQIEMDRKMNAGKK